MITCEKLNATIPEKTCIARLGAIGKQMAQMDPKNKGNGPAWGYNGGDGAVLKYSSCVGCETGLKLLKEPRMGITSEKTKRCSRRDCLKILPATTEFFGVNSQNKDGLSYYCRSCQNALTKASQAKKNNLSSGKLNSLTGEFFGINKADIPTEEKPVIQAPARRSFPYSEFKQEPIPELEKEPVKTQTCRICKREKELTEEHYHKCSDRATGFRAECKECRLKTRPDKKAGSGLCWILTMPKAF